MVVQHSTVITSFYLLVAELRRGSGIAVGWVNLTAETGSILRRNQQDRSPDFFPLASVETHRRGTAAAGKVLGIGDGAEWEQSFLDDQRKDAVRILDWGHASEHRAQAGQALCGVGPATRSAGVETWFRALRHGEPAKVLTKLRAPIAAFRGGDAAREEAPGPLASREARRDQIRDATWEAAGNPIGSGMVESGHKRVVEARLQGAGRHWAPNPRNPLVA
jgi:hypothetical protein